MKLSPKKIRLYMGVVSILFILRYIGLFLLSLIKSGSFVYFLKPLLFLNHLAIPLMVLALSYVYLRWDKLNFNFNYIIAVVFSIIYFTGMFLVKGRITFNSTYGYVININNETLLYFISLIIVGTLLVFCVYFFDKPNNNRHGMFYLIVALTVVIVENILYLGGIRLFPYPIIGDGIFIMIMNLAVNTFKKQTIKAVSSK
ncbi:hypothetical protein [Clostridium sp. HBUAS56017]|nr:hypothetical protein [Clostridium sp. HBUAS56017]